MKAKLLTNNYNQLFSSILIDILLDKKIDHFYTSPGMRNVPLLSSLINRSDETNIFTAIDERASAYRALGYSKISKKPCVLICTSGTALANYFPAIIEATKTQTPLIIISADRPFALRHSGANQTIIQKDIFGPYIKNSLQLDISQNFSSVRDFSSVLSHNIEKTFSNNNNLLHINIAFDEPLDDTPQNISKDVILDAYSLNYSSQIVADTKINPLAINAVKEAFNTGRTLVVYGNLPYTETKANFIEFTNQLSSKNHYIYCDITSSLKHTTSITDRLIPSLDHPEVSSILDTAKPKTIIHFGGAVTSKFYYMYLRNHPEIELITIHNSSELQDPSLSQNLHIDACPTDFITAFLENKVTLKKYPDALELHTSYKSLINKKEKLIEDAELSYPVITKHFMQNINNESHLFIANSTFIRSFDSFSNTSKDKKTIHVHSNRGASGIEGMIATAIGICDALDTHVDLLIGDISFLHDLNSLSLLKSSKHKINIYICNNYSGGIFTLLPIAKDKDVLPMISTPHNINFKHAAKLFHIDYHLVNTKDDFLKLDASTFHNNINIIEIIISNDDNAQIYNLLKTVKLS